VKSENLMNSEMKRVTKARACDCSVAAEGVTPSTVGSENGCARNLADGVCVGSSVWERFEAQAILSSR